MRRERHAGLLRRQAMWAAVVMLVKGARRMTQLVETKREMRAELSVKLKSATSLAAMFRMFVFRTRLWGLWKARTVIRPLIFWWRFKHRIRLKRRAVVVLDEYLAARKKCSAFQVKVKHYVLSVRKIQAQWRAAWHALKLQLDIVQMMWIRADEKRGMTQTAAIFAERQEHSTRVEVIRQDLRERKSLHMARMAQWRKERRDYDAWLESEQMFVEARKLMGVEGSGGAEAAIARNPPSRPVFSIFGRSGHFKVLAERVATKREADRKRAERDWARQDSIAMGLLSAPGAGGEEAAGGHAPSAASAPTPASAIS
jgi:hypothetical protein